MNPVLMRVESVSKKYDGKIILNNVSLDVPVNSSVLIEGASGCGKTTLLRCMALLEKIDEGQIFLDGDQISDKTAITQNKIARNKIGMVFQQLHLWGNMSVIENVSLSLILNGWPKKEAEQKALSLLDKLDIAEKAREYPSRLSGGQQQRVAIARAIIHNPPLLLLDEITASLDSESTFNVFAHIEKLRDEGTTTVIVSHNSRLIPRELKKVQIKLQPYGFIY